MLRDLLLLKEALDSIPFALEVKSFLRLALAAALVPDLTNVTLGRLQLHFIDRSADQIDVWQSFDSQAKVMLSDLKVLHEEGWSPTADAFLADSANLESLSLPRLVDCVITSPPYPNRYSYVWK